MTKQSPNLNPADNLWQDLKMDFHILSPFNLTELELFCNEKFEKKKSISKCEKLAETPRPSLRNQAVIPAKGSSDINEYMA